MRGENLTFTARARGGHHSGAVRRRKHLHALTRDFVRAVQAHPRLLFTPEELEILTHLFAAGALQARKTAYRAGYMRATYRTGARHA